MAQPALAQPAASGLTVDTNNVADLRDAELPLEYTLSRLPQRMLAGRIQKH
jgi:hypothetical protein